MKKPTNLEELSIICDNLLDAVIIMESDGTITHWNAMAQKMIGASKQEALGTKLCDTIFHESADSIEREECKSLLASFDFHAGEKRREMVIRKQGGVNQPVLITLKPVKFEEQDNILVIIKDISARVRSESMLRDIAFEIIGSTSEEVFNAMANYLAEIFSADYCLVGELVEGKRDIIKTIAVNEKGKVANNFEYNLVGSPFEEDVATGAYFCMSDAREAFPSAELLKEWEIDSFIGTPIYDLSGRIIGVLAIMACKMLDNLNLAEVMLQIFSLRASAELERMRSEREIEKKNRMLLELSVTDSLTNLYNHKYILDSLTKEIDREGRYHNNLSIIMFDLDHFKKINDTFGHQVGDEVLISVASTLKSSLRPVDIIGRYGGEEFLAILPNQSIESAKIVGEKIRENIQDIKWDVPDLKVTVSGGIIQFKDESAADLINKADELLYRAKENGRNRMEI